MKQILYVPLFLLFVLAGCNTTKITSSWSVNNPPTDIMNKVLVVAIMQDREERDKTEQEMVSELKKYGIDASSAYDLFGPRGFRNATEEEVTQQLRGSQYTSVMIVSLIDKQMQLNYVPGTYYGRPYYWGSRRYYRRYWALSDHMYTPGYYTTSTNYVLQAEIYTVNDDDELIYSAQTKSVDPSNAHTLADSFAKTIVTELRTKGLVRGSER